MSIPRTNKRTIPTAVITVQKGFNSLAQNLSANRQTELLEVVPTEQMEIIHASNRFARPGVWADFVLRDYMGRVSRIARASTNL